MRPSDPIVNVSRLTKRYAPHAPPAVDELSLSVDPGEVMCLLGPSGCGKTTLLRLIAGFERPDAGTVEVAGKVVASDRVMARPEERRIGFVFQDFALFPHLTVLDNVAFGLKGTRDEKRRRAAEVLALVGLTVFDSRYPHQLSGGQQQRVALARALAPRPHILLLDEPFSNLDASLRGSTRDEVRAILARSGITAIVVTHDQEEALSFGDRVAVMRDGKLQQVGAPEDVYFHPGTAFVASFLGRTNLLRGLAEGRTARTTIGAVPLSETADGRVIISLRPDHLELVPASSPESGPPVGAFGSAGGAVRARVVRREFKGHVVTYEAVVDPSTGEAPAGGTGQEERLVVFASPESRLAVGDEAWVRVTGDGVTLRRRGAGGA